MLKDDEGHLVAGVSIAKTIKQLSKFLTLLLLLIPDRLASVTKCRINLLLLSHIGNTYLHHNRPTSSSNNNNNNNQSINNKNTHCIAIVHITHFQQVLNDFDCVTYY